MRETPGPSQNQRHRRLVRAVLILASLCLIPGLAASKTYVELTGRDRAVYDSLATPTFDTASCFQVRPGSRWTTALGEYEFTSGTLCFFVPVAGRPSGCWFQGKGRLYFRPPAGMERQQLKRFCGDTVLNTAFDEVYFRYFDSTFETELAACAESGSGLIPPGAGALRHFGKDAARDIRLDLAARGWRMASDEGRRPAFLYARPELSGQRSLHFLLDDTEQEAIQLFRKPGGVSSSGIVDLVCSYDRRRTADEQAWRTATADGGIDIGHYGNQVKFAGSGAMALDVTLACRARRSGQTVLPFTLAPDLKIDTVVIDGASAQFVYDDEGGWLLARGPRPLTDGDSITVQFHYRGERLLDKFPWGDFFIHHTTRWLPVTAERHRATYLTTFEFPKYYDVVSVGERIADTVTGDQRRSTWRTFGPASFISFNYGTFERLTDTMDRGIRIDIYRGRNHRDGLFSGDFKKRVAEEIKASIQLFSMMFCPYPWLGILLTRSKRASPTSSGHTRWRTNGLATSSGGNPTTISGCPRDSPNTPARCTCRHVTPGTTNSFP
jgi:hypothetical protein